MHARALIGYTGVTAVLVAALASVGDTRRSDDAPRLLLFLGAALGGWVLGRLLRGRTSRATLARSLTLLGDALAAPCVWWVAQLLGASQPVPAVLGGAAFAATAALRLHRDGDLPPLHPYFLGVWGALLALLARAACGLAPEGMLGTLATLAAAVALGETRFARAARRHAILAAALVVVWGVAATAVRLPEPPSAALLASFHLAGLALAGWAYVRGEDAHPLGPALGGAAWAVVTVALTATLAYAGAPLAAYVAATSTWVAVLAAVATRSERPRLQPFRDSAAWTATVLACALVAATAPVWWPTVGLPRIAWGDGWHEAAWRPRGVRAVCAAGLALVSAAAGTLAWSRRRRPSIAYTVGGLFANAGMRLALAYVAPFGTLLAACTALADTPALVPAAALVLAAAYLLASGAEAAFGRGPAVAGYACVAAAAAAAHATHQPVSLVLVAGALLLFARAARRRAMSDVLGALAALTVAVGAQSLSRPEGDAEVALTTLVVLAVARLLADREAESARSGVMLAWSLLAALWALLLALVFPPWPLAGLLVLWLGAPPVVATRRPTGARAAYDPRLFVGEALEAGTLLVAHCAGAAALVLLWRRAGLGVGDAGPILAGWAWAHLGIYRYLARRWPGRPATVATAIASQTLALASLGLPLASSSLRIAIATLLMNAALFFFWSDHRQTRARRRVLLAAGHLLNLAAVGAALLERSAWAPLALVASALIYLWRSHRTRAASTHVAFLLTVTVAAGLALRTEGDGPALWVPSVTAVGLLAVGALSQAASGRTVPAVRLSWAWAVLIAVVTLVGASAYRIAAPRDFALLWTGFLVSAALWDRHGEGSVRPGEPEDEWLSLASHWAGHLAGGCTLVGLTVVLGFDTGVAAAALGAWAWMHWGVALGADPRRTAGRALAHAARASAAAALVLAALSWRETGPATLACAVAGAFALCVGLTAADAWWRLVAAFALVEAFWIQGLAAGVTLREYYLTTAALWLYCVLRLRRPRAAEAARRGRFARTFAEALLPSAVFALAVGHPFAALLADGRAVHLVCLGGGAGLVLFGFWRVGLGRAYEAAVCALFLGGACYAFVAGGLERTSAVLLLGAGLLVLANLLAGDALFTRNRARAGVPPAVPRGA